MTRQTFSLTLALAVAFSFFAPALATAGVDDDFNRADSSTIDATSDGNDTWSESEGSGGDDRVEIRKNAARIAYNKAYANPGMSLTDLRLANGVVEADINIVSTPSLNRLHGINYRASSNFNARYYASPRTFHVLVKSQWHGDQQDEDYSSDVVLLYGETVLASGNISDEEKDRPITLRVEFNGSSHKVYVDNELVIDYTDPKNRNDEGSVGLGVYIGAMDVDRFKAADLPEEPIEPGT